MSRNDHANLRAAITEEALHIIETKGLEGLSMREVSRRLGVSHQAPYKHFASRDHILAEIVRRSFAEFAAHLDARPRSDDPYDDLRAMGQAYLRYAAERPLQYRLMFGTPLPDPDEHPAMLAQAQHAFALLRDAIAAMNLARPPEQDALFVLATMHGLASITHLPMAAKLDMAGMSYDALVAGAMERIKGALGHKV